jgi:hypothetical protein
MSQPAAMKLPDQLLVRYYGQRKIDNVTTVEKEKKLGTLPSRCGTARSRSGNTSSIGAGFLTPADPESRSERAKRKRRGRQLRCPASVAAEDGTEQPSRAEVSTHDVRDRRGWQIFLSAPSAELAGAVQHLHLPRPARAPRDPRPANSGRTDRLCHLAATHEGGARHSGTAAHLCGQLPEAAMSDAFVIHRSNDENDLRLSKVLERMQRVGWIDRVVETAQAITPHFTPLGKERCRMLHQAEHELERDLGIMPVEERAIIFSVIEAFLPDLDSQVD